MDNPNARNRARRRDPLRRAQRAPLKRVEPNLCPLGMCEHAGLLHTRAASGEWPPAEVASCTAPGCECEAVL